MFDFCTFTFVKQQMSKSTKTKQEEFVMAEAAKCDSVCVKYFKDNVTKALTK